MRATLDLDSALVDRFAADLDALIPAGERLGVAVSGGPDSVALLLLTAAARPGLFDVATVDHGLRPESSKEAAFVADLCGRIGVAHSTLTPDWEQPPSTAIQEQARTARYDALGGWAQRSALAAVATGHHADDQAETLLMRLARGAGVRGLAGMRAKTPLPGNSTVSLVRPLLGWRRTELESVCAAAGVEPVSDPSNPDETFERARIRSRVAEASWLDPGALARSANHLASANEALDWCARQQPVTRDGATIRYRPADAPPEIRRRVVGAILTELASEGAAEPLRGRKLDGLMTALAGGGAATLRGVRCRGGAEWLFDPAPPRRT